MPPRILGPGGTDWGKRIFDLAAIFLAAPIWLPAMVIVGTLVGVKLGRPVFFRQRRAGRNGERFDLIKFRTMSDARNSHGRLLSDRERLTSLGKALRSTSLDELPEIINVLRGEMSLVGPRPLLVEYLPRYTEHQARRHEVHPGLTGLAQVNGRNAISWEEKFEWDVRYVDRRNFWLDLKILGATFGAVILRHGINAKGGASMPEFLGLKDPKDSSGRPDLIR